MTRINLPRRSFARVGGGRPSFVARLTLCAPRASKPEKSKVVLAVGGKSALYYLPLTIAERKGFFKDAGLDVEINDFQGGSKSLEALMGGSADVTSGAYEHTIRMQQRGQPIKGFVLMGRGMQIAIGLRKECRRQGQGTGRHQGHEVRRQRAGLLDPHAAANFWAAKGGLKATDVVAIGVGAGATVVAAIEKGQVDGVSQTDPALTILQDKGMIKIMVDTRTTKGNQEVFGGPFPAACLYAQPDFLTKNPEHRAGARHRDRARRRVAADGLAGRRRQDRARGLPAGRPRDLREVVRRRARVHLAGRHDAGRRAGQLPEVPGRRRSQARRRQGQDQARGHLDQRVRAARQEARVRRSWQTATRPALALDDITCRFAARDGGERLHGRGQDATLRVARGRVRVGGRPDRLRQVHAAQRRRRAARSRRPGTVAVFGEPLAGINRRAGYMFQAEALMPWRTALDNVTAGLEFRGVPTSEARERGEDWLRARRPRRLRRPLPAPALGRHAEARGAGADADPRSPTSS